MKRILIIIAVIFGLGLIGILIDDRPTVKDQQILTPHNAANGEVWQVRRYLKNTLHDPDSYQPIFWGKVATRDSVTFWVRHRFRAANQFGGLVVNDRIFYIKGQRVISVE